MSQGHFGLVGLHKLLVKLIAFSVLYTPDLGLWGHDVLQAALIDSASDLLNVKSPVLVLLRSGGRGEVVTE